MCLGFRVLDAIRRWLRRRSYTAKIPSSILGGPKNSFILSFASWVVPQEFLGELPDRRIGKADSRSLARIEQVEHRGQSEPNSLFWSPVLGPESWWFTSEISQAQLAVSSPEFSQSGCGGVGLGVAAATILLFRKHPERISNIVCGKSCTRHA